CGESHQAGPKLTQNRVIEARISQFQAEGIFPIQATAHRISCLPVGEILHKLENRHQSKAPGGVSWLSAIGKQILKELILIDGSQIVTKVDIQIAFREDRTHDSNHFLWDIGDLLRFQAHHWPPALLLRITTTFPVLYPKLWLFGFRHQYHIK